MDARRGDCYADGMTMPVRNEAPPAAAAEAHARAAAAAQVARGEELLAAGRILLAAAAFTRALQAEPDNPAARGGLAVAEQGADPGPRLLALLDAMERDTVPAETWAGLADRLAAARRPGAVLEAARRAVALHGADAALQSRLGAASLRQGHAEEAAKAFGAALLSRPASLEVWQGRLDALWHLRRHADAAAEAEDAIAEHPDAAGLRARRARALLAERRTGPAERAARDALALDGREEMAHLALVNALALQQRMGDALAAARAAAGLLPASRPIVTRVAQLALASGQAEFAVEAYAALTGNGAAAAPVWIGRVEALRAAGRGREATEAALAGLAAHPRAAALAALCAQLLLEGDDAATVRDLLATAMGVVAAAPEVRLALAEGLLRREDAAAAMAEARAAAEAEEDCPPEALIRIGTVLLGGGDHRAAAEAFAAATEAAPGLAAAWIGLSDAHRLARRIKPAIAAFRQAEAVGAERHALRALRFRLFGEWGE